MVGEAATAEEAVRRIGFQEPDVVILDLDLPDGSRIEVCRQIQTLSPKSRVLILTAFADEHALISALQAGARAFVLKRVHDFDLMSVIRRVASGDLAFDHAPTPRRSKNPQIPSSPGSPNANRSSSPGSPKGKPTGRSPTISTWRKKPSSTTSPTSS